MAISADMALSMPPPPMDILGKGYRSDMPKVVHNSNKGQTRTRSSKAQPFDPEDLRRRLRAVIADQEAQEARLQRQRGRVDSLREKKTPIEQNGERQEAAVAASLSSSTTTRPKTIAVLRRPAPISKSRSRSRSETRTKRSLPLQDKPIIREKPGKTIVVSEVDASIGAAAKAAEAGLPYVPAQAATQFKRTTTSERMREKSLVHSLSKAALRFYSQGTTAADRDAIHSSLTPGKQQSILRRARGQRDRQHVRNQFQGGPRHDDRSNSGSGTTTNDTRDGPRLRRTKPRLGGRGGASNITMIPEDAQGESSTLADLHLHRGGNDGYGGDEGDIFSTDDGVVAVTDGIDLATAVTERRIDWTQSDEPMMPGDGDGNGNGHGHGKRWGGRRGSLPLHLPSPTSLLKKTSSIFKLRSGSKFKMGGSGGHDLHRRRNDDDDDDDDEVDDENSRGVDHDGSNESLSGGDDGRQGRRGGDNNRLRIVTTEIDIPADPHQIVVLHHNVDAEGVVGAESLEEGDQEEGSTTPMSPDSGNSRLGRAGGGGGGIWARLRRL
ncbi:hypothetical protein F5Y17DRAFT_459616 [Xylariaceae sp. FL0594]|nr:hypothetical protein F5Y17DRAFT_459616 [Xylariaceae sp. FL0594]